MKAVVIKAPGGIENLSLEEMDRPGIGDDEVLVKVHSLSVNPVDIKTRKGGAFFAQLAEKGPAILGWDISGVIEKKGRAVTSFAEGDEVFGMVNFPGRGLAYAEFVAAPAAHLAPKPAESTHEEAAATTLAALTAWQVLVQQANIEHGQRVLIHAAAGGVGHFAVQIAKYFGATVIGTASAANRDYLKELGVDEFIDYNEQDPAIVASNIDIVLDPIGGDTTLASLNALKRGGILVSIVGGAKEQVVQEATRLGVTAKNYLVQSSGDDMRQLAAMMEDGSLQPTVSHRFRLEEIGQAHQQIETGRTRGKIVVNPD